MSLDLITRKLRDHDEAKHVVIWLHGLGADNTDFLPIIPNIKVQENIKFIFPNAPLRKVTIAGGYSIRAWYDIYSLTDKDAPIDYVGISESVAQIQAIIDDQIKAGIASKNIYVCGFSQGAATSYATLLQLKHKLGGIIALSGYLPFKDEQVKQAPKVSLEVPVLACHGKFDMVVSHKFGHDGYLRLTDNGYKTSWLEYPIEHNVSNHEINDISAWLQTQINLNKD